MNRQMFDENTQWVAKDMGTYLHGMGVQSGAFAWKIEAWQMSNETGHAGYRIWVEAGQIAEGRVYVSMPSEIREAVIKVTRAIVIDYFNEETELFNDPD